MLGIHAPGNCHAVWTGIQNGASAKIRLEGKRVGAVHIMVASQVAVAGICAGAGPQYDAPAVILFKDKGIRPILIRIPVKVPFTFTRIAARITLRGKAVLLVHAAGANHSSAGNVTAARSYRRSDISTCPQRGTVRMSWTIIFTIEHAVVIVIEHCFRLDCMPESGIEGKIVRLLCDAGEWLSQRCIGLICV